MPSHNHGGSTGTGTSGGQSADHNHGINYNARWIPANAGAGIAYPYENAAGSSGATAIQSAGHTHSVPALSISPQGGSGAHNNLQPYLTLNYAIYAGA